jgi:hypothetical protein
MCEKGEKGQIFSMAAIIFALFHPINDFIGIASAIPAPYVPAPLIPYIVISRKNEKMRFLADITFAIVPYIVCVRLKCVYKSVTRVCHWDVDGVHSVGDHRCTISIHSAILVLNPSCAKMS